MGNNIILSITFRILWIPNSMSVDSGFHKWLVPRFRNSGIPDSKAVDSGFHGPKLPGFRITVGPSKCEGRASRERKERRESKCVEDKRTKGPKRILLLLISLFRGKLTNAIGT